MNGCLERNDVRLQPVANARRCCDRCSLQMLNKIALCSSEPVRKWLDDKTREVSCM